MDVLKYRLPGRIEKYVDRADRGALVYKSHMQITMTHVTQRALTLIRFYREQ